MEEIKLENTKYLSSIGIEVPDHLPIIENHDEVNPRSPSDVASRLSAIAYVIGIGFDADRRDLLDQLEQYKLLSFVSDYEAKLLRSDELQSQDKINMTWLTEAAQSLAWCLGLVEFDHFNHCDDDLAQKIPFRADPSEFISNSKLRPLKEIQRQVDLLYRMHWYARNCRLTGEECILNESVVSERRKAIDWVYGVEENWDEIPLDT